MAVILKNGAVFLHIPKTGGTWVTGILRDLGLARCSLGHRHADWAHLLAPGNQGLGRKCEYFWKRTLYLKTSPRPFTFCFVRHPLDWYESFYSYKSQESIDWEPDGDFNDANRWHPNSVLNGLGRGKSFDEFVEAVVEKFPGYVSSLYSYYTLRPVDFIGKQETLREDLVEVLQRMGLSFEPEVVLEGERINRSRALATRLEWDSDLRERVVAAERAGMLRFGYEA